MTIQLKDSIRGIIAIQSPLIWVEISNAFLFYIIFQPNISLIQFSNSKHSKFCSMHLISDLLITLPRQCKLAHLVKKQRSNYIFVDQEMKIISF